MGPYRIVHMETCSIGNGNHIIIKWVLCPIVTAMAITKVSFAFAAVSMNEPLRGQNACKQKTSRHEMKRNIYLSDATAVPIKQSNNCHFESLSFIAEFLWALISFFHSFH